MRRSDGSQEFMASLAFGSMMAALSGGSKMAFTVTRSAGMLLLAIWLIFNGLAGLTAVPVPHVLMAALALIAGALILVGR
jgi:hypothetical protein